MSTGTASAARRRLSPDLRKAEIADHALSILIEKGYWGLSFAEVASASGLTLQGVLHHFPTKDELLLAVLERRDRLDIRSVTPEDHGVGNVQEFLAVMDRLVQLNQERPELIRLYTVLSAESINLEHPAHAFFAERFTRSLSTFAALAAGWHSNPDEVAFQVHCALDGLQLNWLRNPSVDLLTEWRIWASHYFARYLDAGDFD